MTCEPGRSPRMHRSATEERVARMMTGSPRMNDAPVNRPTSHAGLCFTGTDPVVSA